MLRRGNLFDAIFDWENLRLAVAKSLRGKRNRNDARDFVADLDRNLVTLQRLLASEDFQFQAFKSFTIFDPKERLISAPTFRDRVVHHAVFNVCEPIFERQLIHTTYACRKGKGREACIAKSVFFSQRHQWYLKLDIRKYFDSISHSRLKLQFERIIKDQKLLAFFQRILETHAVCHDSGLPIGTLASQHFANFYLSSLDHFVKEELSVSGFVRYMDDMVLWANSKDELKSHLFEMKSFLQTRLGLEIKDYPLINRCDRGIPMLGCIVFPSHVILNRRSKRRFFTTLKRLENSIDEGVLGEQELQQRTTSLIAFCTSANVSSWRFRNSVLYRTRVAEVEA